MTDGAGLLTALATLDRSDALAVNAFNLAAFVYVRPLDAPCSGRYVDLGGCLVPRAPDMLRLPDLPARIAREAQQRGERP